MTLYEPKGNELLDAETGRQLAVILPVGISKKLAAELAKVCADYLNNADGVDSVDGSRKP